MEKFWKICPFTLDEIKKGGKAVAPWRHLGVWAMYQQGVSMEKAGDYFGLAKSSAHKAIHKVESAKKETAMQVILKAYLHGN
jgi:hypothetical protein